MTDSERSEEQEYSLTDIRPEDGGTTKDVQEPEERNARTAAWHEQMKSREQLIAPRLSTSPPSGEYYEALIPDTLDLAECGALALNSLTQMLLDAAHGYGLYAGTVFGANPAFLNAGALATQYWGDYLDVPKITEALPQMRVMSGSRQDLDRERGLMLRLLAASWDDGVIHGPPLGPVTSHFPLIPRFLLGMTYWHQYDGNPLWMEHADKIYRTIRNGTPKNGSHRLGCYILGLTRYAAATDNQEALDLAGKLVDLLRQPQFWHPLDDPVGVVGEELGHSIQNIELHGILFALRGLLEYAQVTNDAELKRFVRSSYEYYRSFGIPEIGWIVGRAAAYTFTETCAIADMLFLAVKLSDYGVGDYWEDVDQYVRNQLIEQQLSDKEQLMACAAASFPYEAEPPSQDANRAIERSLGSFACIPFVTYSPDPWTGPCCNHNGAQALYQAWEGIVRDVGDGDAQVNLLLNRASPQLDVDSYLPYEGKVVVRNKTARRIRARIPGWVSKPDVCCRINNRAIDKRWLNNYLLFEGVQPGDQVTIEFPVAERVFKRTEGASGDRYTIRTLGNTVTDIQPRPELEPVKIEDGRLVVMAPARMTVKGIADRNITVRVDARSVADAGIILRYTSPGDYILAYYCNPKFTLSEEHTIAVYEMVKGAYRLLKKMQIEEMGPDISLSAEVNESEVNLVITNGVGNFDVGGLLESNLSAGSFGLYAVVGVGDGSDCRAHRPSQRFDNFSATGVNGNTIFEDGFDDSPNGAMPQWQIVSLPNRYRFYLRDHLKQDKAPMVRKIRFVPTRIIKT